MRASDWKKASKADALRKWRYYAARAKKFRTRKKYRRMLREYINSAWTLYAKPEINVCIWPAPDGSGWWMRTPYNCRLHLYAGKIEHTFYAMGNEPILFVWVDTVGTRYLCSCCKLGEEWVICEASAEALVDLIDERATIREIFENGCGHKAFAVWDGTRFEITGEIPADALPEEGETLELEREKNGPYRKALGQRQEGQK